MPPTNPNFGTAISMVAAAVGAKAHKRRKYQVKERLDLKRRKRGLLSDTAPVLLSHRRKRLANDLAAKRPHEPRIVQREKRLAARAAAKAAASGAVDWNAELDRLTSDAA